MSDLPPTNETFQDLVNRMNSIQGEPRASVLIIHLYIEYLLNWILKKKLPKPDKIIKKSNFATKTKLIESFNVLTDDLIYDIEKINEIRNLFAHNIDIESTELQTKLLDKIKDMKVYNTINEPERIPPYNLFVLISIRLYHHVKEAFEKV